MAEVRDGLLIYFDPDGSLIRQYVDLDPLKVHLGDVLSFEYDGFDYYERFDDRVTFVFRTSADIRSFIRHSFRFVELFQLSLAGVYGVYEGDICKVEEEIDRIEELVSNVSKLDHKYLRDVLHILFSLLEYGNLQSLFDFYGVYDIEGLVQRFLSLEQESLRIALREVFSMLNIFSLEDLVIRLGDEKLISSFLDVSSLRSLFHVLFEKPSPVAINLQLPNDLPIVFHDVLFYFNPNYVSPPEQVTPFNFELDDILSKFYTIISKGVIVERLDRLFEIFEEVFSSIEAHLDYEIQKLNRDYALKLSNLLSVFGVSNNGCISGKMVRDINVMHTDELLSRQELVLRLKERLVKEVVDRVNRVFEAISKVNSLYADIFEKDFVLTEKAFRELLEYQLFVYNSQLDYVKAMLAYRALNFKIFDEKLKIMQREFAMLKERYVFADLEQEKKEAINQFLLQEQEYLTELEKYKYLQYEMLQVENQVYSAELRKFATEIEKINKLAAYIKENVAMYLTKLEGVKAIQRLKDADLDIVKAKIQAEKIKVGITEELLDVYHRLYKTQYAIENNLLERMKLESLDRFKLFVEQEIVSKVSGWYNNLVNYLNQRNLLLTYLEQQATIRNRLYSIRNFVETQVSVETYKRKVWYEGYEKDRSIFLPASADYYRTCALTCAQITAEFIRSYKG